MVPGARASRSRRLESVEAFFEGEESGDVIGSSLRGVCQRRRETLAALVQPGVHVLSELGHARRELALRANQPALLFGETSHDVARSSSRISIRTSTIHLHSITHD